MEGTRPQASGPARNPFAASRRATVRLSPGRDRQGPRRRRVTGDLGETRAGKPERSLGCGRVTRGAEFVKAQEAVSSWRIYQCVRGVRFGLKLERETST